MKNANYVESVRKLYIHLIFDTKTALMLKLTGKSVIFKNLKINLHFSKILNILKMKYFSKTSYV